MPKKRKGKKKDFLEQIPLWQKLAILVVLLFFFGLRIELRTYPTSRVVPRIQSTQILRPTQMVVAPIVDCVLPSHLGSEFTAKERIVWPKVYRWCPLIMKESLAQGINPRWPACVMLYESGGDPTICSYAGACGLFQVMASNGESARRYPGMFRDRPTVEELFIPEINVKVGVGILRSYLLRNATLSAALRGYNGGNNHVYANAIIEMCTKLEAIS